MQIIHSTEKNAGHDFVKKRNKNQVEIYGENGSLEFSRKY